MTAPNREQFANAAQTTLNGALNNSQTNVVVTSGAVFPSVGNFRIIVESEIMLVIARSSNTLTVVRGYEGTSAVSHADTLLVTEILTAGSLDQVGKDNVPLWGYASRPALNRIDDGSGGLLTSASFSWDNQGGATAADEGGTISILAPAAGGENIRALYRTAPSPTYSLIAAVQGLQIQEGSPNFGIGFRQSTTGKMHTMAVAIQNISNTHFTVFDFNSSTSLSGARLGLSGQGNAHIASLIWFKLTDNNTNLLYSVSLDGVTWIQILSHARGTFMTLSGGVTGPNQLLFYINNQGSSTYNGMMRLLHWHTE